MSVGLTTPRLRGPATDQFEKFASFSGDTLSLDPNDWNRVFVLQPDDGEGYIIGRGEQRHPMKAEGWIGAHLMNNDPNADGSAEQIHGRYRITVRTKNNGTHVTTLDSGDLANIDSFNPDGSRKKNNELTPQPRTDDEFTTKEYTINFEVKPSSSATLDTSPASGTTEFFVDGVQAERTA